MEKLSARYVKQKIKKSFLYILLIALVSFTGLPLVYVLVSAFKPIDELFIYPPRFWVSKPTLSNFSDLFMALNTEMVPFSRYFFNSVFTTLLSVFGTVVVCSMGAFSIVKHRVPGAKIIYNVVIAALMFSPHVTMIQNYLIVNKLGLINTYTAIIIVKLAVAYNFFIMRQFFLQIPDDYIEAARLDGAGEMYMFWRIIMPIAKPAWATLIVFSFVTVWNDFFTPLIFTTQQAMKTLPLAMQSIAADLNQVERVGAGNAAALITILPVIIIYVFMQGKVISTMALSGIKA